MQSRHPDTPTQTKRTHNPRRECGAESTAAGSGLRHPRRVRRQTSPPPRAASPPTHRKALHRKKVNPMCMYRPGLMRNLLYSMETPLTTHQVVHQAKGVAGRTKDNIAQKKCIGNKLKRCRGRPHDSNLGTRNLSWKISNMEKTIDRFCITVHALAINHVSKVCGDNYLFQKFLEQFFVSRMDYKDNCLPRKFLKTMICFRKIVAM